MTKAMAGLRRLYARIPFACRLAARRCLHAVLRTPMPPVPFGDAATRIRVPRLQTPVGPGVNLAGYAKGEFGVAQNVRSYAHALERAKYPFSIFDLSVGDISRQRDLSMAAHFSDTLGHGVNVFFVNAEQLPILRSVLGRGVFAGRYNVGFWAWELESFPVAWSDAFRCVDEVWAQSRFTCDAIARATRKPVLYMPTPIEFEPPAGMGRDHFGLPDSAFTYLFSFDFNSHVARKNPGAVIAAFRRAFADGAPNVRLFIKSTNGERYPAQMEALRRMAGGDSRIEVRDGFLSRPEMFAMENAVDCYVSLHRAEGFGLGMAECMYLGKPVIATGYSGNLDFMRDDNSLLVDYVMAPLHAGDYPHWQGQRWAEPDIGHAACLLRKVFDDPDMARAIGRKAAVDIRHGNSNVACGAALTRRLNEVRPDLGAGRMQPL